MKIEQQVCTLEQAKKLKELGIKQDSYLTYELVPWDRTNSHKKKGKLINLKPTNKGKASAVLGFEYFAAFTVAELGEMLGYHLNLSYSTKDGKQSWLAKDKPVHTFDTEAECRASLLIHLIESSLLSV